MSLRVGVTGATGRMGSEVCRAVAAAEDLELVAAVDRSSAGAAVPAAPGLRVQAELDALEAAEVVVDFTTAAACREVLAWCAGHGRHAVVGTTGVSDDDLAEAAARLPEGVGLIVAPNFAIGAVLMMRFAELAAPWFDAAEVIELHHDGKLDAPSGTAMLTARRMAEAAGKGVADATRTVVVPGARGGEGPGGIRIHSVRLNGLVAHQEVLLGTTGQTLTIRHDSLDRTSFMPGVLAAVRAVPDRPGLTVGLDAVLGLP